MGWVQKRQRKDGAFSYKVFWRDPAKRVQTKTFRRKTDAVRHLREIEHQKDVGTYIDPGLGKITLAEFWDHFIRTAAPPAESTQELYRMQARRYIIPRLGRTPLRSITKPAIRSFLADLQEEGRGAATINSTYRTLRRILAVAVDEGRIPVNPAARVSAPKSDPREMQFLTPKEVLALSQAVDERFRVLILFLAYTGARIGEAAALRMKNVDFLKSQARIVEASKEVNGRQSVGPTKNRLNRSITLPEFLVAELSAHVGSYSDSQDPDALVFPSPQGVFVRQKAFRSRVFRPAAKKAGLSAGLRPHDLRHTAVALAIEAGWHPRKIQEMLGHSSIEVTLGTYGHLFDSLHGEGADRLDALFRESTALAEREVTPMDGRMTRRSGRSASVP